MVERFLDAYLPEELPIEPVGAIPRFSTQLTRVDSDDEQANRRWAEARWDFRLRERRWTMDLVNAVRAHFLACGGPFRTFPFRDPTDFASVELEYPGVVPAVSRLDQQIGTGDGAATQFQLKKRYTSVEDYDRTITLPVAGAVLIAVNGVDPGGLGIGWTVSRPGGVVTFDVAITAGWPVHAGFLFDNEVRYESDDAVETIAEAAGLGALADLNFVGVRRC